MNKKLLQLLGRSAATLFLIALSVFVVMWMWNHYERSPWTRDGRVRADVVRVTPDIGGLVTSVAVRDNETVRVGELLFVIDRPRYTLALQQAEAAVTSARAVLAQAQREATRDVALGDLVATEEHEQNVAKVQTARAALDEALSARETARLNLRRTQVHASVNGRVTNLDLHPGDYVAAGQQAMALVDSDSLRVEGYFEETKLPLIRLGAPVKVHLMGEARDLRGVVESIAPGIDDKTRGNAGNLMPSIEPTFSWVRLAQRIPVRIEIDAVPDGVQLAAGMTCSVDVGAPGEQRVARGRLAGWLHNLM